MSAPVERVPRAARANRDSVGDDSVVSKVARILHSFSGSAHSLGLSELSRRSGVTKASTFRLAEQLVEQGLLVKAPNGYELGWWVHELGQYVPGPARLRAAARPTLVDLRAATNALVVHLAVPHGEDVVYLERIGGRREVALLSAIGTSVPADQTVSGHVLQAYRARVQDDSSISAEQRSEYDVIRDRRWASEREAVVPGAKTFAVPIEYRGGAQVMAVVSATVHASRQDEQSILRALWAAAVDIARAVSTASRN